LYFYTTTRFLLEVGIGSGLNLPFYSKEHVKHLTAIDPSRENWEKCRVDLTILPFEFEFITSSAESIPDFRKALAEIRRVLNTGGKLLFCEHGKAPDRDIQIWQNLINPFWKCVGGGCNLNRDIPLILKENGFKITHMDTAYIHGKTLGGYNYWGEAKI
jgi:ubiquinone/menaquinone biosynthesis C-methylase UbiE